MIVLPWPDRRLSPNARVFYMVAAKLKKEAKAAAYWLASEQTSHEQRKAIADGDGPIPCRIVFYPPDNRQRDDDNAIGSFKAARDGIALALGVDDRRFRPHYFFAEPEKPGRIEVHFFPKSAVGPLGDEPAGCYGKSGPPSACNTQTGLTENRLATGGDNGSAIK